MGGKRGVISPMEFFSRSASNQNLFSPSFHRSPTSSSCHASQRLGLPGSSTAESPPSYSPFVDDSSLVIRFKCAAVGAGLLCMIGSPELEIYVDG